MPYGFGTCGHISAHVSGRSSWFGSGNTEVPGCCRCNRLRPNIDAVVADPSWVVYITVKRQLCLPSDGQWVGAGHL